MKDEDSGVQSSAVEALGEMKSERAVEPLIKALKDGNWRVRQSAAEALGMIGSKRAEVPLIKALKDEDWRVRSSAAEALGKIGALDTIPKLKVLLKAKHPYKEIIFEVISAVEKSRGIRSGIILFEEGKTFPLPGRLEENPLTEYFQPLQYTPNTAADPDPENPDPTLAKTAERINGIKEDSVIVDYGCGKGKFAIEGLLNVENNDILEYIKYIGVDINEGYLEDARLYSEAYGFDSKVRGQPEFILVDKYFNKHDYSADFIFCLVTFHDIKLVDLYKVIYHNLRILKNGGSLIIYDKGEMPKADEIDFVIWEREDFEALFNEGTLKCDVWIKNPAEKDRKEIHVVITKKNEGIPSITAIEQKCVEVYGNMEKRCSDELYKLEEKEGLKGALTRQEMDEMHFLRSQGYILVRQLKKYQKDKSKKEDTTKYHVTPTIDRHRDQIEKAIYEMRDITGADLLYTGIGNDNDFLEFCLKDFSETWLVQEIPQTTLTGNIRRQIKIVNRHLHGWEERHENVLIILLLNQKLSYDEKASLLNQLQIFHSTESLSTKIRFKVWDRTDIDRVLEN